MIVDGQRNHVDTSTWAGRLSRRTRDTRRSRPDPLNGLSVAVSSLLVLFLVLPMVGLVLRAANSGRFFDSLGKPIVVQALRLSLETTVLVMLLSLGMGSPLALLLARRNFHGKILVDTLIDLPIVLPPAVAGLALLLTFGRNGLLGAQLEAFGIELPFTTAAVVMASLFVAAPFYVRAARSGFLVVPPELEEAARLEGATEWQVFRYVTMPVAAPALFGGAVLCWARALGEFGATIMFAGSLIGRTQTMPLAIYSALETDLDAAVALSVLLLAISFVLLMAARGWLRRATEAGWS
ncbi:MAG: molybdate ABC transporter permease subunit [Chloroflexi bacterium]|nr:molybdate ABC transporter permease subunit [Chloroflexota bacterium]